MALASLRRRLLAGAAALGLALAAPFAVQAAMAVVDATAIAKAGEQISELKKQLDTQIKQLTELKQQVAFLNDISEFVNDVSKAIGSIANITLPIPNIQKMAAQIRSDARCLMPDGLGWGIRTEDLNLASICETSARYRDALFVDNGALARMGFNEREAARRIAAARRTALLEDTTTRALAQADVQMQQADELNGAADDLQSALSNAQTVQDRAHIEAQIGVAQVRATAQQTQILAQMLKLQAAAAIMAGLPPDQVSGGEEDEE